MAYVVTEPCRDCKYTDCVTACPVECFYQDGHMLYIDPDECICCGACVPVCPVEAIYDEPLVPEKWRQYVALNAERVATLREAGGHITEKQQRKDGCG